MEQLLKIGIVQCDLIWKDKTQNLHTVSEIIRQSDTIPDIIFLPEMFNTGFCIDDLSLAEDEQGTTLSWMKEISITYQTAICGSFLFVENAKYYNRLFFVASGEIISTYDKRHLFSLVGEEKLLTKGERKVIIKHKDWLLEPFICYDLRFPEWCANRNNVAIQFFVANWPHKRIHHWIHLLKARAIENQCYVVGVNRTGLDFYGNAHHGYSAVYDFKGEELMLFKDLVGMKIVDLHLNDWITFRERYPFYKDR